MWKHFVDTSIVNGKLFQFTSYYILLSSFSAYFLAVYCMCCPLAQQNDDDKTVSPPGDHNYVTDAGTLTASKSSPLGEISPNVATRRAAAAKSARPAGRLCLVQGSEACSASHTACTQAAVSTQY